MRPGAGLAVCWVVGASAGCHACGVAVRVQHPREQPGLRVLLHPQVVRDARALHGLEAFEEEEDGEMAVGGRIDLDVAV